MGVSNEMEKALQDQAEAANKEQAKAEVKVKKEAEKAAKDAEKAAAKEQAKAEREAAKAAKAEEAAKAKEAAKAAKEANRMPMQNGVRRPKPDTLCGKAWAIFDQVSQQKGSPAAIGECLPLAQEQGLNPTNVRVEYARWRKYFGVTGRIENPAAAEKKAAAQAAKAEAKAKKDAERQASKAKKEAEKAAKKQAEAEAKAAAKAAEQDGKLEQGEAQ